MPNPEDQEARMRMDASKQIEDNIAGKMQKRRFSGPGIPEMIQKQYSIDPHELKKILDTINLSINKLADINNQQQSQIKQLANALLNYNSRLEALEERQDPGVFNKILTEDETQALFDAIAAPARDEEEETHS